MDIEDIKKDFFHYCCDINMMFKDRHIENKESIISIIKLYGSDWTKEFHYIIENQILNSINASEICLLYAKYVLSSNSYGDFYCLAEILYKLISSDLKLFEIIFIYFYNVVFYTENVTLKYYFKENKSLIEFYKITDNNKYKELLKMTKVVLSKDIFHSDKYRNISTLIE